jgi:hypothetical protein
MEPDIKPTAASIIAGLLNRAQIAAELDCSERTILRFEQAGLPVIRLGMLRLYDPVAGRQWLMTRECKHTAPKRGRPAGRKAA